MQLHASAIYSVGVIDGVTYRLIREGDLGALGLVQGEAARWLAAHEGRDPAAIPLSDEPSPPARRLLRHLLAGSSDLCWLAEVENRPVGFGTGIVRGDLWLLSNLFVHPDVHDRGIGQELLRRCFVAGRDRGSSIAAVISSSHASAQSLYIRLGMVPRVPLFILRGPPEGLASLRQPRARTKRPRANKHELGRLGDLDRWVWGRRRDIDHQFWWRDSYIDCRILQDDDGKLLGYVYFGPDYVGPLAARTRRAQLVLLRVAGEAQMEANSESVLIRVPGVNVTVLRALLEHGFRIDHVNLMMTSHPFGRFDRYLPSGGVLL